MPIMSTNFAWKREYDVKRWRHKKRTPNANAHHLPLNETPHENFLPTPLFAVTAIWVVVLLSSDSVFVTAKYREKDHHIANNFPSQTDMIVFSKRALNCYWCLKNTSRVYETADSEMCSVQSKIPNRSQKRNNRPANSFNMSLVA